MIDKIKISIKFRINQFSCWCKKGHTYISIINERKTIRKWCVDCGFGVFRTLRYIRKYADKDGNVEGAMLYSYALTPKEVLYIYNNGATLLPKHGF